MRKLTSLLLVVFLATYVIAPAQAANAPPTARKSFMWEITGGKGTVYLLGSIHLVTKDFYPLSPCIEERFKRSNKLVVEVDETKGDPQRIQQLTAERGVYRGGDTIANHLSPDAMTALSKYITDDPKDQSFYSMKPWLVGMMIPMRALMQRGFDPNIGIDKHFIVEAKNQSKPIDELETAEYQLNLLSSFDDPTQEKLLLAALVDLENTDRDAKTMVHAWKEGDAEELTSFIENEEKEHPELKDFTDQLLYQRNKPMVEKLDAMLKQPGTEFVVVGAAHLIGERGLLKLLSDRGYSVKQVSCP